MQRFPQSREKIENRKTNKKIKNVSEKVVCLQMRKWEKRRRDYKKSLFRKGFLEFDALNFIYIKQNKFITNNSKRKCLHSNTYMYLNI